jgi:hypothetical protein
VAATQTVVVGVFGLFSQSVQPALVDEHVGPAARRVELRRYLLGVLEQSAPDPPGTAEPALAPPVGPVDPDLEAEGVGDGEAELLEDDADGDPELLEEDADGDPDVLDEGQGDADLLDEELLGDPDVLDEDLLVPDAPPLEPPDELPPVAPRPPMFAASVNAALSVCVVEPVATPTASMMPATATAGTVSAIATRRPIRNRMIKFLPVILGSLDSTAHCRRVATPWSIDRCFDNRQ